MLGFCLGGSLAFAVAADFEPTVAVSYYGSQVPAMLSKLDRITVPILFHFGSLDEYIPGEGVEALVAATAGRDTRVVNIEIAGHAFDNEARHVLQRERGQVGVVQDPRLPRRAPPRQTSSSN